MQESGCNTSISPCTIVVPQGSVVRPLLFSLFISSVSSIAAFHKVSQRHYADDTQLFIALSQSNSDTSIASIQTALISLYLWSSYNGLTLNPDKSDTILLGTSKRRNTSLSNITSVNIAGTQITLSNNLWESRLTPTLILISTYYPSAAHLTVIFEPNALDRYLVSSRLDYANDNLYGVSQLNLNKLQKVQPYKTHWLV